MEIRDEQYYEMMYTFRMAMCTLYGLSDKAFLSVDDSVKNGYLTEMKEKISEYSEMMEKYSPECEGINIACVEHITMKDTKALVIDDNDISNYLMVKMLEQLGVSVDVAESGYEGIKACKNNDYDIIFVDYIMPDMDGVETVEHIRNIDDGKNRLIIGITASVVSEFKEGLNRNGTEIILFKPVKKQQIAFILYQELRDKSVR